MLINKIIGTSVGADLSAFVCFHNTPLHLLIHIIGPNTHQLCTAVGESRVMLSAVKHLGPRVRSFASLRMTNVEVA